MAHRASDVGSAAAAVKKRNGSRETNELALEHV
jgi:hypothetical protein